MRNLKATLACRPLSLKLLVSIAATLLCAYPATGQHRPHIRAVFETKAPLLRLTHSKEELKGLDQRLSDSLARLGNQNLGFLDWSSKGEDSKGAAPTSALTVLLIGKSVAFGGSKTDEFFLDVKGHSVIEGRTGTEAHLDDAPLYEDRLYRPLQVIAKDMVKLEQFIQDQFEKWFKNPDFLKAMFTRYLGGIPISSKAEVLAEDRLGVPLLDSEIRANSNSTMRVDLQSTLGEHPADATLNLGIRRDHVKVGEWYDKIQCKVTDFTFGIDYKGWQPIIRTIFRNQIGDTLRVYMTGYEKCIPATNCSIAVTPK